GESTVLASRASRAAPLAAEIGAAEARTQLRHAFLIDLAIGTPEAFEHLWRKPRKLCFGNRRRGLTRLAAHGLAQSSQAIGVERLGIAVADIRADFGPTLGIDGAVGVAEPLKHLFGQAREVVRRR